MHNEITDRDIRIGLERARRLRAEAAGDFGRYIRNGASKLTCRAARALAVVFSPSKPQH